MAVTGARPASHPPRPTATRRRRVALGVAGLAASVAIGAVAMPPVARAADEADPLLHVLQALAEDAGTSLIVGDAGAVAESDPDGRCRHRSWLRRHREREPREPAGGPGVAARGLRLRGGQRRLRARGEHGQPVQRRRARRRPATGRAAGPAPDGGPWRVGSDPRAGPVPDRTAVPDDPFAGASHAFVTRIDGERRQLDAFAFVDGEFTQARTDARSMWVGDDLLTLIPVDEELLTPPVAWDVFASSGDGSSDRPGHGPGSRRRPAARPDRAAARGDVRGGRGVGRGLAIRIGRGRRSSTSPTASAHSAPPSVAPSPTGVRAGHVRAESIEQPVRRPDLGDRRPLGRPAVLAPAGPDPRARRPGPPRPTDRPASAAGHPATDHATGPPTAPPD